MDKKEVCELIERFTTDDVLRPQLRMPWIVDGKVYATDGKIAIRLDNAIGLGYEHVESDLDLRFGCVRSIDAWRSETHAAIDSGRFERIALHMSHLRKAACAAVDDARKYVVCHCPETTDDIEQMTVDEAVEGYSVVILPGSKRHVVAAKYANLICDAVDAFGPVEILAPVDGFKRGDYGRYRILCHGTGFDILLMALRSDQMDAHGVSVADSVTATLVHSVSDDSFVSFARLQFPEK